MSSPYYQYKEYMIREYGMPLYRIPIDLGFSCPHRDDQRRGGCTFCAENGARAVQNINESSIQDQISKAVRFARERYKARKFQAYFQAYSASFEEKYQKVYQEIIGSYDFSAVSFGVRSDLLNETALNFLQALNKTIDTWVELGIQTVHDKTLQHINRGHDWAVSKKVILELATRNIKSMAHVIIGLPGETKEDFIATAQTLADLPIKAIKIHNLHVIRNTVLAKEFTSKPFSVFQEFEYAEYLMEFLRYLPANLPVVRMTTDTLVEQLIAPVWHMTKNDFLEYLTNQMLCREIRQGDKLKSTERLLNNSMSETEDFKPVRTDDNSITFRNNFFNECYHTSAGARLEAAGKYVLPAKIGSQKKVELLDICFGMGYNSLVTVNTALTEDIKLNITALEMDKRVVKSAAQYLESVDSDVFNWNNALSDLYQKANYQKDDISIVIYWGDARYTITKLAPGAFDLVYLDAFSTNRNSELWTIDFFQQIKKIIKPAGVLLTYTASIPVRSGLQKAGFFVGETTPIGRNRGGTIASLSALKITKPLSSVEIELIESRRGTPFRDPYHVWPNRTILRNRELQLKS